MRVGGRHEGRHTFVVEQLDAFCSMERSRASSLTIVVRHSRRCGPFGLFNISCTAFTACSTSGNCAMATFVGTTGAKRSVAGRTLSLEG